MSTNPTFSATEARKRCLRYRAKVLELSQNLTALHIAPTFSCLELVDTTYFGLMRREGTAEQQDTFLLSKGHGALAQYLILEELGILPSEYIENFCREGSPLGTHPDYGLPGIEASTGSLGHGLGLAVGMAYADKLRGYQRTIFTVMSDGELQEGSVWEAMMMAPNLGLNQMVALVDLNDFQSMGRTSEILPNFYPIADKVKAFGWECAEVNGHNCEEIVAAASFRAGDKPLMIIGHTIKGKGVGYMEGVPVWHYRSPSPEEFETAMQELKEVSK